MDTTVLICIIAVSLFFCIGVIYFILTLMEVSKLVKESRNSLAEINKRVNDINNVIDNVNSLASNSLSIIAGVVKVMGLFAGKKKDK
jgi:uncharacterized protein YoxC